MPRKNNKSRPKFQRFEMNAPHSHKKRYPNQREAQKAVEYLSLTRGVELEIYQDIDGGWYLTSKNKQF